MLSITPSNPADVEVFCKWNSFIMLIPLFCHMQHFHLSGVEKSSDGFGSVNERCLTFNEMRDMKCTFQWQVAYDNHNEPAPFEWADDHNIIVAPCCVFKTLPCINCPLMVLFWNVQIQRIWTFCGNIIFLPFVLTLKADSRHSTIWTWTCRTQECNIYQSSLLLLNILNWIAHTHTCFFHICTSGCGRECVHKMCTMNLFTHISESSISLSSLIN